MALTLSTAARNAAADAIVDLIDVGGAGDLVVGTTSLTTVIVTNAFSTVAFGAAAVGIATANPIVDGTVTTAGTAAEAKIQSGTPADIITGLTVSTSGADINLSSLVFAVNDKLEISSMTATMPAS